MFVFQLKSLYKTQKHWHSALERPKIGQLGFSHPNLAILLSFCLTSWTRTLEGLLSCISFMSSKASLLLRNYQKQNYLLSPKREGVKANVQQQRRLKLNQLMKVLHLRYVENVRN